MITDAARSDRGPRPVPSILLTVAERQGLLDHYRRAADPKIRLRAHILLLLDAGHPWATISAVLFCSVSTISRWKRRFEAEGVIAVHGWPRGRRSGVHVWAAMAVRWVLTFRHRGHANDIREHDQSIGLRQDGQSRGWRDRQLVHGHHGQREHSQNVVGYRHRPGRAGTRLSSTVQPLRFRKLRTDKVAKKQTGISETTWYAANDSESESETAAISEL
jgi:hypothetical protein